MSEESVSSLAIVGFTLQDDYYCCFQRNFSVRDTYRVVVSVEQKAALNVLRWNSDVVVVELPK